MNNTLKRLWRDESGEASGLSLLLIYTILALGATVGLVTLRDQIVQEYGDLSVALDSLNQNWFISDGGGGGIGWTDDEQIFTDPAPGMGETGAPADLEFGPPGPEAPVSIP